MSKRSYRRLAVVTGVALAVGSMAPAMALRLDGGAGATAEVAPEMVINDVLNITQSLPLSQVNVNTTINTAGGLLLGTGSLLSGTVLGTAAIAGGTVLGTGLIGAGIVDNVLDHVALPGGLLSQDCALVAVASCNNGAGGGVTLPVNASGLNVLGGGILNNNNVGGGLLAGLPLGAPFGLLDGLLDVQAGGSINVIAGVLGSL